MRRRLLIDLGNSRTKWALAEGSEFLGWGAAENSRLEELPGAWQRWPPWESSWLAGVGQGLFALKISELLGEMGASPPKPMLSTTTSCGLANGYLDPQRLGVDRWAAIIGGHRRGSAACIVDAGTAITIDAVDPDGQHLGGMIIPGLELMADSLAARTARIGIPAYSAAESLEHFFGRTTEAAICAGTRYAAVAVAERALGELRRHHGTAYGVITGGDGIVLSRLLPSDWRYDEQLVLRGILRYAQEQESDE